MFCPECQVEYREGFTECSDCRVALVEELPEESESAAPLETVVLILSEDGDFINQATALLKDEKIEFFVDPKDTEASADNPVGIRVRAANEPAANDCLRELMEGYSLSDEDVEFLKTSQQESLEVFLEGDESTSLVAAAEAGHAEAVEKLLERGADVNQKNDIGQTPLMAAAAAGDEAMVEDFISAGADVNAKDPEGATALLLASRKGRAGIVELLLKHQADVNARHDDGFTALALAAEEGRFDVVRVLLAHDADVNAKNSSGKTALQVAEHMGYNPIVRLLEYKQRRDQADESAATDDKGRDPLMAAAAQGEQKLVEALLDIGADIEATDAEGRTALMWAAMESQSDIAEILLSRDAEVDAADNEGGTALTWAADQGSIDVVQVLLHNDADPTIEDNQGWTPLQWAKDKGYKEIVALLRQAQDNR